MNNYILRPDEPFGYSAETTIDANSYSIDITLPLQDTGSLKNAFSKTITVISDNVQTGFEVDLQRQKAVEDYLIEINA